MTNEKAAKIICSYLNNDPAIIEDGQVVPFEPDDVNDALWLAAKLLCAEPCDYAVDKKEVERILYMYHVDSSNEAATEAIENLPPVRTTRREHNITTDNLISTLTHPELENERLHDRIEELDESQQKTDKTGHWIVYMDDIWYCCKCSECSKITSFRYMYCPNCGAKMEKEYEQRDNCTS